jgi:hypothetical protein
MVKKNVLKVMEQMYGPDGAMPDLDTAALDTEGGETAPDMSVKLATWLVKLKRRFAKK